MEVEQQKLKLKVLNSCISGAISENEQKLDLKRKF
jgi:hypothetical protein